jgi:serine/threonine-protein kinase
VREKRFAATGERSAGKTPVVGLNLPPGAWQIRLAPQDPSLEGCVFPVLIGRGEEWRQDVVLPAAAEAPPGFRFVPAGPFTCGGIRYGGAVEEVRRTRDFHLSVFPVTSAEYLEYLNERAASGTAEESLRRQPKESERPLWRSSGTGRDLVFRLPDREPKSGSRWDPRWPVLAVDWRDALACCAWRSARDGRLYTLPHEDEFEKAARGVDARVYPWGNEIDACFCHTNFSLPGGMSPLPVGSFPIDASPYGVRDLAGGAATWCLGAAEVPYRQYRQGTDAGYQNMRVGLRLTWRPDDLWADS